MDARINAPCGNGAGLAHKFAPYHPPATAALRGDGDAIAHDRHPFAAIQLLFNEDRSLRANVGDRHQVNARLRCHLLHHLLKTSGVVAKDQRVDGFCPFALGQRPTGFHIAKMRREQQFALRIVEPQRLLRAWRKDQIAMEFHFAAPAGHFIQHGMTEAQEVGKTV